RGHTWALTDFINIDRINRYGEKGLLPATCWNCKTPKMMNWIKEYGDEFWAKDVNTFRPADMINEKENSISCATCHDPATMELRLYSVPLSDWLKRSGRDWNKISLNEKRALVCAQCHVEYYFTVKGNGPTAKPVFPWDNGLDPENFYEYYKTHGPKDASGKETPFHDFIHAASKTPIIKMQHPDYEMWSNGPHGSAGVSCADCHMPYMRMNGQKFSSHWMTSPLKDPEMRACRQCHYDKTPEYLRDRVLYVQSKTYDQLLKAEEESVRAHEAIRLASEWDGPKSPDYDKLLAEAREANRKGQMFWDYVSAENGVGFHNPAKSLDTLMTSMECSNKAVRLAEEATNWGIAPVISGDIKKLVPPILTLRRVLQQDREFLDKNPWTKILPTLPKHPQVWFNQEYRPAKAEAQPAAQQQ
ncbi:MAG: ammonia-forming cytochrome c nitrite reductase subunit c552, partial [Desulfovibrio sp.]|nr:ammonia-forming cytochrome c nitrite reductase subunit c552 [Desulfovibrio sp.]